jgi:hypothetical protein
LTFARGNLPFAYRLACYGHRFLLPDKEKAPRSGGLFGVSPFPASSSNLPRP